MRHMVLHLKEFYDFLGNNNADPTVEIYLPLNMSEMNRQNSKRPCMIVCPGGSYFVCSQREGEPIGLEFLADGYNVFVLKYSTGYYRFPTQIREVAALMELIYSHSDEWNCDTSKISIIGFSAGGHLAAHYSTMYNCKEVREVFPQSKPVNATLLAYAVITADVENSHHGSFENLIGHMPESKEEEEYFSCQCQVDANTPPTFIWHTAEDTCVPVENSLIYAAALSKNKIPFELHIYPFGRHALSTSDSRTCDNINEVHNHVRSWLDAAKKWLKLTYKI